MLHLTLVHAESRVSIESFFLKGIVEQNLLGFAILDSAEWMRASSRWKRHNRHQHSALTSQPSRLNIKHLSAL